MARYQGQVANIIPVCGSACVVYAVATPGSSNVFPTEEETRGRFGRTFEGGDLRHAFFGAVGFDGLESVIGSTVGKTPNHSSYLSYHLTSTLHTDGQVTTQHVHHTHEIGAGHDVLPSLSRSHARFPPL